MSTSRAVGIDLGTTHCALTRLDHSGRSAMIRNSQGDMLIPGTVYFEDEELLFGRAASHAAATQPQRAAECAKRDFGHPAYSRAIEGQLLPSELIAACLLKDLCADLPTLLGGPPAVALAVPAAFDQAQRRGMIDAARIAGLDVLGTINDPLATALAFAEMQGYLGPEAVAKQGCRVLVFDLGGGKLDVAIVEIKPARLRTLGVAGDARLGGRDWDSKLADFLAEKFARQFGDDPRYDMVSVRRLLSSAEEAKHTLTARQQARVHVQRHGNAADVVVQRHAFEDATADLVERARKITEEVVAQAGMAWRDVSHLLLVGGATRMPMIARMVESVTGLKAAANMHADEAVARGAVLYAAALLAAREGHAPPAAVEITDMTAHSVGMAWKEPGSDRAENVVLIPRGAELPTGTTSRLATVRDDQASLDVQLLEGESRDADQCRRIARITIGGLPSELPAKSIVELHCQITAEGRLQVKAQLPKGNYALSISVDRGGGLTDGEMADWRRLLSGKAGLKAIHAQLAKHAANRPEAEPAAQFAPATAGGPIDEPPESQAFQLDLDQDATAGYIKKARSSPKKLVILMTGYIVSAVVGLAIGYYILLMLRPELNVLRLPLPGLRLTPRGTHVPIGRPRAAPAHRVMPMEKQTARCGNQT